MSSKKQFEAWLAKQEVQPSDAARGEWWKAWQASRKSLKAVIPEPLCRYADDSYKAYTRKQVEALLNDLGVKIIEEEL